jgi:acyl-CoA dehydrogenase
MTDDWAHDVGTVTLSDAGLRGTVNAVRFAAQASLLVVVATTDAGAAVCLVDPAADGVRIEDLDSIDPTTAFARVALDVRPDAVAQVANADGDLVNRIRAWARLLIACELSGVAQRSLELTVEYIAQREQFDRPIGSFQAVKHIAADMHTRCAALHNLCLAALADVESATVAEIDILASTAKAYASNIAVRVCEDAIQLHGGMGFTTESDVSWYYKRALSLRAWYGDETELELRIGAAFLASTNSSDFDDVAISDPAAVTQTVRQP